MQVADIPSIIELSDLNVANLQSMVEESVKEGHLFVQKTITEWTDGSNKFSKPGEKLWGIVLGTGLIGIGGLNRDPYTTDKNTGRLRHLYILKSYRRRGYATLLVGKIIDEARQHFTMLRLFTDNDTAGLFYETMGFKNINDHKSTHEIKLD